MGLDMFLSKRHYVKRWDHIPREKQFEVTVKRGGAPTKTTRKTCLRQSGSWSRCLPRKTRRSRLTSTTRPGNGSQQGAGSGPSPGGFEMDAGLQMITLEITHIPSKAPPASGARVYRVGDIEGVLRGPRGGRICGVYAEVECDMDAREEGCLTFRGTKFVFGPNTHLNGSDAVGRLGDDVIEMVERTIWAAIKNLEPDAP
jgi:hypothetical protein